VKDRSSACTELGLVKRIYKVNCEKNTDTLKEFDDGLGCTWISSNQDLTERVSGDTSTQKSAIALKKTNK